MTETRTPPPGWERASEHPDVRRPFPEVLREHMAAQGIRDLEELWEKAQASGETENLQRWRFMRMCEDTYYLGLGDRRFLRSVVAALGYEPWSEEAGRIALCTLGVFRERA